MKSHYCFLRFGSAKFYLFICLILGVGQLHAQTLEDQANQKITELEVLITAAEKEGIDTTPEKTTVRTAEVFLKYANWDEANKPTNVDYFKLVPIYADTATQAAESLPDHERREIIKMLDESAAYLTKLIAGEVIRKPGHQFDWSTAEHQGDQIVADGRPVFLSDYTWKPATADLTEYHGNEDGFYISPSHVSNQEGDLNTWMLNDLTTKESGTLGFIFLNNKGVKQWAEDAYGPGFIMREDTYTGFDIDNPGAKEMMGKLLEGVVPTMDNNKYSELGYMLCNEPHFYTNKSGGKNTWASGPVSEYSKDKFRTWLEGVHGSIATLNTLWGTSFASFDDVTIEIPIDLSLRGTPMWYDWATFNNYRVTEWYKWLKAEIRKYDPDAKVHLKIMPNLWTENERNHGIDMEALTEMSEIIGNDAGAAYKIMWGHSEWEEHYQFEWREMCMGHDFYKSVSPNKIMFNTEAHFLSTVVSRDMNQDPRYARATFWMAHTQGLTASQTWFWARQEDGSIRDGSGNGYAGSNNQQPRIVNEVAHTMYDINAYAEEVLAMQRQRKPIRIFYSESSAFNKSKHMDDVFELYEDLNFEGVPLGFATKNIIESQDKSLWDVILVHKTEYVTEAELAALQSYLNAGGTVIVDAASLQKNEYGQALSTSLSGGNLMTAGSSEDMAQKAMTLIESKGNTPGVTLTETNTAGFKGCIWKCITNADGNQVVSIVNTGKVDAKVNLALNGATKGTTLKDLFKGIDIPNDQVLQPYDMLFVEVRDEKAKEVLDVKKKDKSKAVIFPNPTRGDVNIRFSQMEENIEVSIFDILGRPISTQKYSHATEVNARIDASHPSGTYVLRIQGEGFSQSQLLIKE